MKEINVSVQGKWFSLSVFDVVQLVIGIFLTGFGTGVLIIAVTFRIWQCD